MKASTPGTTSSQNIVEGDQVEIPFAVPAGATSLTAHLEWSGDWGAYPTNDLDVYLVAPSGAVNAAGATLNAPEFTSVSDPAAGNWLAVVDGFAIPLGDERYKLVVAVNGKVVK